MSGVMALVVMCVKEARLAIAVKLRRIDRGSKGQYDRSPLLLMRLRRPSGKHWLSSAALLRIGEHRLVLSQRMCETHLWLYRNRHVYFFIKYLVQ